MIKLSKTSKLGCMSWSLQALETCPGSIDKETGKLVAACSGCYATSGNYRFPNVKAPRIHNREDWKRGAWVDDMVAALQDSRYFRWFDSGDLYSMGLAHKILEVMERTPWCRHWLPTRMHKFPKFQHVLRLMELLPNVVVRRSSDAIDGTFTAGLHGSTIGTVETLQRSDMVHVCGAYANDGKCGQCRACWDKSVPVIGYVAHGRSMLRNIKISVAA